MKCDTFWEANILLKFQAPSLYSLGVKVAWRYFLHMMSYFIKQTGKMVCVEKP